MVCGTHLNHFNSAHGSKNIRQLEIDVLLGHLKYLEHERAIVVADFNQQRQRDYLPSEWQILRKSMAYRGEPEDDRVCSSLEAGGFRCCFDFADSCRNWPTIHPPPTHWTSTAVDYSFGKGMQTVGV